MKDIIYFFRWRVWRSTVCHSVKWFLSAGVLSLAAFPVSPTWIVPARQNFFAWKILASFVEFQRIVDRNRWETSLGENGMLSASWMMDSPSISKADSAFHSFSLWTWFKDNVCRAVEIRESYTESSRRDKKNRRSKDLSDFFPPNWENINPF